MNMLTAIAESAGNKARALNDNAATVVVQERYEGIAHWWFHIWHITKQEVSEADFNANDFQRLRETYFVDPEADYWQSV